MISRFNMNKTSAQKIKDYMQEGLDSCLAHCWTDFNQLGLHDEMIAYEVARAKLESEILKLYEVYSDTPPKKAQCSIGSKEAQG